MWTYQLAYAGRVTDPRAFEATSFDDRREISGVLSYRPPFVFHIMEGPAAGLADAFGRVCRDERFSEVQCVLFRPVDRPFFSGPVRKVKGEEPVKDVPRPIDLWVALNLECPRCSSEAVQQIQFAIDWFVGRPTSIDREPLSGSKELSRGWSPMRGICAL